MHTYIYLYIYIYIFITHLSIISTIFHLSVSGIRHILLGASEQLLTGRDPQTALREIIIHVSYKLLGLTLTLTLPRFLSGIRNSAGRLRAAPS